MDERFLAGIGQCATTVLCILVLKRTETCWFSRGERAMRGVGVSALVEFVKGDMFKLFKFISQFGTY